MTQAGLIASFRQLCTDHPGRLCYVFVNDDGTDERSLSYAQVDRMTDAVARHLVNKCGLTRGDRAMLVYPPSLDFVLALIGCMKAGIVPVPGYPPSPFDLQRNAGNFAAIAENAGARVALTTTSYQRARTLASIKNFFTLARRRGPELTWHRTDNISSSSAPAMPWQATPDELALLQYTSGSTSAPRGVMITYGNLDHQLAANRRDLGLGPESISALWVPQYHDFGLVSGILSALYGNGTLYIMSPLGFARRPALWFDVLSRVRATHTAAPNFAYGLALRKTTAAQRMKWDLRHLQVMMSAAEPIDADLMARFFAAFAGTGLTASAFCPAYGLAENTVGVTVRGARTLRVERAALEREQRVIPAPPHTATPAITLQGCGVAAADTCVRIVDPQTRRLCEALRIGEIWVDSPSKASGYFGLPEATEELFQAQLADSSGAAARQYLRTGDLGFIHEGELFVTGRLKDLMILRGRKVYPHDIEHVVSDASPSVRPGRVVAFSAPHGRESRLVVVLEIDDNDPSRELLDAVIRQVRAELSGSAQTACHAVVIVPHGTILKTTSGKLRRSDNRDLYIDGTLAKVAVRFDVAPETVPWNAAGPAAESEDQESQRAIAAAVTDPLLDGIAKSFHDLLTHEGLRTGMLAQLKKQRATHGVGVGAIGSFTVLDELTIPEHAFFVPGQKYRATLRHASAKGFADDAVRDGRGATLRVWNLPPDAAATELPTATPLLDLILNTGCVNFAPNAELFFRWFSLDLKARLELCEREMPYAIPNYLQIIRDPGSFSELHYHSQVTYAFTGRNGVKRFLRYRLRSAALRPDTGFVAPEEYTPPLDHLPRNPADTRTPTYLRDGFRAEVAAGQLSYLLQLQLRPIDPTDSAENERAQNSTIAWEEASYPFHDVARIDLDAVLPDSILEPLRHSVTNVPAGLGIFYAKSPTEAASINHARAVIYRMAAEMRAVTAIAANPPPPPLIDKEPRAKEQPAPHRANSARRSVAVLGGGISGLTAAYELTRLGHDVTLFEQAAKIGGKCESLEVDGHPYDLGGHLITSEYHATRAILRELGIALEPATFTYLYSLKQRAVVPPDLEIFAKRNFFRYELLRRSEFAQVLRPGLAHIASSLSGSLGPWLASRGIQALYDSLGINYTSSGYGTITDPELAALYFVKGVEMTGLLSRNVQLESQQHQTVQGGMQTLLQRLAAALPKVECGVTVQRVDRDADGVSLTTADRTLKFDDLVLAMPLDAALAILDASAEERQLFADIRYLDYYTTVCRIEGLPRLGFYLLTENNDPAHPRLGYPVSFHHRYADSDVYTVYSYGAPDLDGQAILDRLRADVATLGGQVKQVLTQRRWRYMPHARPEAIAQGFYQRLEALQGIHHTYYVGSLLNFELIENNIAYARETVRCAFAPTREDIEPRAPWRETLAAGHESLASDRPATLSEQDITHWLVGRLAAELRVAPDSIDPTQSLESYSLDSVTTLGLVGELSNWLGWRVAPGIFVQVPSLAAMAQLIGQQERDPATRERVVGGPDGVLVPLTAGHPGQRPLFCVCPGEARLGAFQMLAGHLDPGRPFYALRPSRSEIDTLATLPPATLLSLLIDDYITAMRSVQPEGPYLLGGNSASGIIVNALAHRLQEIGAVVDRLILLDPMEALLQVDLDDKTKMREVSEQHMVEPRSRELLAAGASSEGGAGDGALALHIRALTNYQLEPYKGQALLVVPELPAFRAAAARTFWSAYIPETLTVQSVPGDHHTFLLEPNAATVAAAIESWLRQEPGASDPTQTRQVP